MAINCQIRSPSGTTYFFIVKVNAHEIGSAHFYRPPTFLIRRSIFFLQQLPHLFAYLAQLFEFAPTFNAYKKKYCNPLCLCLFSQNVSTKSLLLPPSQMNPISLGKFPFLWLLFTTQHLLYCALIG